ncbi:ATP-binding protein [Massilia sp. X63]|uniref:ATP-binding protein n=1 Tax=Massilia sp. X63 TaxID=3237285 RepID=UPI0034DD1ADD
MDILIPTIFDRESILRLLDDLDATLDVDHVTIDFRKLRYSMPTGMLVAGSKLRKWRDYRRACGYKSWHRGIDESIQVHSYLMHLGFFDFLQIDQGKQIGQAKGSARYLPIKLVKRPSVNIETDGLNAWYDSIMDVSRSLAAVVAGSADDTEELRTYAYCIREVIRNVFEHAQIDECFICGQRWADGRVEIAIIDEGVGLAATLTPEADLSDDESALLLAVRPGVSRTALASATEPNTYDNSGFGLFVLTELAANFGWFVLGSGSSQMTGRKQNRDVAQTSFQGTYFGMHFNSSPHSFAGVLDDIIQFGEQEAGLSGISRRASGMSRFGVLGSR